MDKRDIDSVLKQVKAKDLTTTERVYMIHLEKLRGEGELLNLEKGRFRLLQDEDKISFDQFVELTKDEGNDFIQGIFFLLKLSLPNMEKICKEEGITANLKIYQQELEFKTQTMEVNLDYDLGGRFKELYVDFYQDIYRV